MEPGCGVCEIWRSNSKYYEKLERFAVSWNLAYFRGAEMRKMWDQNLLDLPNSGPILNGFVLERYLIFFLDRSKNSQSLEFTPPKNKIRALEYF